VVMARSADRRRPRRAWWIEKQAVCLEHFPVQRCRKRVSLNVRALPVYAISLSAPADSVSPKGVSLATAEAAGSATMDR